MVPIVFSLEFTLALKLLVPFSLQASNALEDQLEKDVLSLLHHIHTSHHPRLLMFSLSVHYQPCQLTLIHLSYLS